MSVEYLDDCKRSLISLKACGVCRGCKSRISEIKAILRFYEVKQKVELKNTECDKGEKNIN